MALNRQAGEDTIYDEILTQEAKDWYFRVPTKDRKFFSRALTTRDGVYDLNDLLTRIEHLKQEEKMKIPDEMLGGNYITTDDIGKKKFDSKKVTILDEGTLKDKEWPGGKKEKRLEIAVKLEGTEKTFSLSRTNLTTLCNEIDRDSNKWIGREIELVLLENNIGDNPLRIEIKI